MVRFNIHSLTSFLRFMFSFFLFASIFSSVAAVYIFIPFPLFSSDGHIFYVEKEVAVLCPFFKQALEFELNATGEMNEQKEV